MSVILPLTPRKPSHQDWEAVRLLITKLWYDNGETTTTLVHILRHEFNLDVSEKTLKTRLREWGLIKKMNSRDAEDLRVLQTRLEDAGERGILLLRGRVQTTKRVSQYQHRRDRNISQPTTKKPTERFLRSHVVALSLHPRLRREPVLKILAKFESVLRELQYLLQAAKDSELCIPGQTTLDWSTSTAESERLEKSLQYSTWEGARAFEEGNLPWAGLCWQSALLALEDLIWEPDLNIWITFIRCCVRLIRFQAKEVAQCFLARLRWLRDELPYTAPHRTFIHALTDMNLDDLAGGCLFILETKLRTVECIWPLTPGCRIEYRLLLCEEQFYHGLDSAHSISDVLPPTSGADRHECRDIWLERCRVSSYMLLSKYSTAETIATNYINQLENDREHAQAPSMQALWTTLADWYFLLGTIQYYSASHAQSQISFSLSIQLHNEINVTFGQSALEPVRIHRMLTLLTWLNSASKPDSELVNVDLALYKQKLENDLTQALHSRENTPFRRRLEQRFCNTSTLNASGKPAGFKPANVQSLPLHRRTTQRAMPASIDIDKCENQLGTSSTSGTTMTSPQGQFLGRHSMTRPKPGPRPRPVISWD